MTLNKTTKKIPKPALLAACFLALLLVIYVCFAIFFQSHFCFRTTVNGVKVSGNSVKSVESKIAAELDGYELTLEERTGETETISGSGIDMNTEFDGAIEKVLDKQNGFAWPMLLFRPASYTIDTMITYDENKLADQLEALQCMDETQWTESKDAEIGSYTADGYEVIDEVYGTAIDREKFEKEVSDALVGLEETLTLEDKKCYVDPVKTASSEEFKKAVEQLNRYAAVKITYDVGDEDEVLDGSITNEWFDLDDNCNVTIDDEQVNAYVKELATEYNTAFHSRSLATSYGQTVDIIGGDYGWKIDQTAEAELIKSNIEEGESVEREPEYSQTANSHGTNDYGNTYVEINLTAQHLFFYKNGALIVETDFVSGNTSNGNATPVGAYDITYKEKDATLNGENYSSKVSYWMPFNNNVGMHDASWRAAFGGSYYKRSGSHGCVNLPPSAAKTIFENIDTGYPVLVYELPGTESALGIAQDNAAAVDAAIATIGDITIDKAALVATIRAQYDALTEDAKPFVAKYDVLVNAETMIAQQQAALNAQQAQTEASPVITAIDEIGEVTADSKKAINAARKAYDALSDAAKAYVTNYSVLEQAESELKELD